MYKSRKGIKSQNVLRVGIWLAIYKYCLILALGLKSEKPKKYIGLIAELYFISTFNPFTINKVDYNKKH